MGSDRDGRFEPKPEGTKLILLRSGTLKLSTGPCRPFVCLQRMTAPQPKAAPAKSALNFSKFLQNEVCSTWLWLDKRATFSWPISARCEGRRTEIM